MCSAHMVFWEVNTVRPVKGNSGSGLPVDLSALLAGWIAAGVLLAGCALILTAVAVAADWEPNRAALRGGALISVLCAAWFAGRKCACRAWLNGITAAIGLMAVLGWLTGGFAPQTAWLAKLKSVLQTMLLGMVGGMAGGLSR